MKIIKGAHRAHLTEDKRLPYEGMTLSEDELALMSESRMFAGLEGTRDHAIKDLMESVRGARYTVSDVVNDGIHTQTLNENTTSGIVTPQVLGVVNPMAGVTDGVIESEDPNDEYIGEQEELDAFMRELGEEFDLDLPEGLSEMSKDDKDMSRDEKVKAKVEKYYKDSGKGGEGNLTGKQNEKAAKVKEKVKREKMESREVTEARSPAAHTGIKNVYAKQTSCSGKPAIRFEDRRGAHLGTFHIVSDGTLKEARVGRQAPRVTRARLMEHVSSHNTGVTTLVESAISKARQRAIAEAVTGFLRPLLRG
jgi:hypothetical protein